MPCTTLLAGKIATYDGSTLMARNEDSGDGHFTAKKFIVVQPADQPSLYRSVISKVEIPLPDHPLRYTAMPNALPDDGIWGEAGINEANVAMSETETLTSNSRVLGADPLVKSGIGEEDMLTIVLPYIRSAREGVTRLGALLEQYGTYEMNGIGFQDVDEIWWFESVGGHHWIAKRVPDDAYVVMPNQQGIDFFDFTDALGEKKGHMCCADLPEFIEKHHLDLAVDSALDIRQNKHFDVRAALGSHSDSDHMYNTPRAWYMLRYFNRHTCRWDGPDAQYTPESDCLPWSMVPEHKITIEDFKYVLSSYYQGTPYNPYSKGDHEEDRKRYRVIGINRNNFLSITQLRPYMPEAIRGIQWIAVGSNPFNQVVPFYTNADKTPEYLAGTDGKVTTDNFYWSNRIIGALADAHYGACIAHVERYQLQVLANGHRMLQETDQDYLAQEKVKCSESDSISLQNAADCTAVRLMLTKQNQKIADMVREETDKLLDRVLFAASLGMKNSFARSDG